jgi:hypothetical protein
MREARMTDAELSAIEERSDPADIARLVAALREANAALANPLRFEQTVKKLTFYLGHVDLWKSTDKLVRLSRGDFSESQVEDCTKLALRLDLIRRKPTGRLELTKRGKGSLPKGNPTISDI